MGTSNEEDDTKRKWERIEQTDRILAWCKEHIGQVLQITCVKDFKMVSLWDDRAVQVEPNTGRRVDGKEE